MPSSPGRRCVSSSWLDTRFESHLARRESALRLEAKMRREDTLKNSESRRSSGFIAAAVPPTSGSLIEHVDAAPQRRAAVSATAQRLGINEVRSEPYSETLLRFIR